MLHSYAASRCWYCCAWLCQTCCLSWSWPCLCHLGLRPGCLSNYAYYAQQCFLFGKKGHSKARMFLTDCVRLGWYQENSSVQTSRLHPRSLLISVGSFELLIRLALSRIAHEPSFWVNLVDYLSWPVHHGCFHLLYSKQLKFLSRFH